MYVVTDAGKLSIYGANGELLCVPEVIQMHGQGDALQVLHMLECIVRYGTILALNNEEPGSQLAGLVKLRLRRYVKGSVQPYAEDLPSTSIDSGGELTISVDPDREEHNLYVVDVLNASSAWVYPHVFMLNPDYSIVRLYPLFGQQEALRPHGTLPIGLGLKHKPLNFYLPEGWNRSRDVLKLIATKDPCDLQILEQNPLKVLPPSRNVERQASRSLERLLETIFCQSSMRSIRPASTPREDWTTAELPVTTIRRSSSQP